MASKQIKEYVQANPSCSGFDLYSQFPHAFPNVPAAQKELKEVIAELDNAAGASTAVAVDVEEPTVEAPPEVPITTAGTVEPEKFDEPENEELRLQIFRLFDKGITDASVKTALGLTDELIAVAR